MPNLNSYIANRTYFQEKLSAGQAQSSTAIKLSLLIPSLPERAEHLESLYWQLEPQIDGEPVELLIMTDNRKRTIGAKRNALVEQAQGAYVAFVDDDDRVSPHYVRSLLTAIEQNPETDCIVFDVQVHMNGSPLKLCKYGLEYEYGMDDHFFYRKPNHLMCHARRNALKHKFIDTSYGEDDEWARRLSVDITSQSRVHDTLYHYDWVIKPREWYYAGARQQ
ncbi:glycosyltransferase family 2 protein [Paenibacillaceae bacterium]|nr:glycosyltransferase family 2 protein [Paenibacillaceae bacterium]